MCGEDILCLRNADAMLGTIKHGGERRETRGTKAGTEIKVGCYKGTA